MVQPFEIGRGGEHCRRFRQVKIEIAAPARDRLVAAAKQKAGHRQPFLEVLALEPSLEFGFPPGAAVVPDGQYAGHLRRRHRYLAAVTMISTLLSGVASLASTVARAGVLPGDTQASQTAFISAKVRISASQILAVSSFDLSVPASAK